ncbi:hypothetical protein SMACR_04827 [Sordaria macrospora]|uniref:DH domain-containing protein n=2 Tax=Sordaria macrospora TaxID=5147 RepID=A0A8S8ZXS4_SORMA|nr:hypothetical protein SMACR_04827 [Sordaria macrospora]
MVPVQPDAEDEYVPQPYTYSSQNYETTVTILGPENDFRPLYKDQARDTMPPSGLHHADEPPLNETLGATGSGHSHSQHQQHQHQQQREEPRVEVENLERLEDFYIGPHLRDNIASLRDSTFTLSDNGDPYDAHPPSTAEYQQTPDSSHSNSLAVPAYLSPGNRLSQHSAWTDFSFGSDDQNAALDSQDPRDSRQFKQQQQQTEPEPPASYNNFDRNRSSLRRPPPPRSPELSPLDQPPRASTSSMLADKADPRQSSEFDRDNSAAQKRIPLVSHQTAPARPAAANNYDDLDESTYEVLSRPNSYPHTHDEKEFGTAIISSPPSAGQFSFETVDRSHLSRTESKSISSEATDNLTQEQKRLRQRQLVIRELIDTEEIFVRDMSVVEEIYKGTAEACPQLDSKTIKLIFRNTDDIIAFHLTFLAQLKDGAASVYQPKGRKSPTFAHEASSKDSDTTTLASINSGGTMNKQELDDDKDRQTSLGPLFTKNIDQLKAVHEVYLRTSDLSAKRLIQIQEDDAVKVWLNECSEGAKELTAAWSLDSLLIKPMQRLTKYPDIIAHLLKYTPADHPDRDALVNAKSTVISAIDEINRTKRNFELVGQIVGNRKRKDSDVRAGLARAFGKRVDKLQGASNRAPEDEEYAKLHERFGDEFLRLQVVLRDVEFYTRSASTYVHEFLQYVTAMELVMRLQPSRDYAHIESRWVQFSVSMRDMEKILDKHLVDVRKHVIEPFEQVIKCYQNPGLAIKKRAKRRLDYERYMQLKANGKKIDKTLAEAVEQYEALDDTLKKELPKLSNLTAEIGNICLAKFVNIQAAWYSTWKEKVKSPLADLDHVPDLPEIVKTFQRDFTEQVERAGQLVILKPVSLRGRTSQSTSDDIGSGSVLSKTRSRPSELLTPRGRGLSINSDYVPSLPTPDVLGRFDLSPTGTTGSALPSPGQYYRDFYSGLSNGHHSRGNSTAPLSPDPSSSSAPRSVPATHATSTTGGYSTRPTTGRSFDSGSLPRQSTDSYSAQSASGGTHHTSTHSHNSQHGGVAHSGSGHTLSRRGSYTSSHHNYATSEPRRQSGLFHSALPMDDADELDEHHHHAEAEAGPSGHSGHDMHMSGGAGAGSTSGGGSMFISAEAAAEANVMWLAASLFEFNIETTKHEGGYPYLTYQAGEIFDVVAEKGELWLAKNQDDPTNVIGWIWSKHFAKLAE